MNAFGEDHHDVGLGIRALLHGLAETARTVNAPFELEDLLRMILGRTVAMVEACAGSLLLVDGETVRVAAAEGGECYPGEIYDAGRGVVGRVVATGEAVTVPGELLEEGQGWFAPAPLGAMSVPVLHGELVLAVINATAAGRPFDADDLVAVQIVAEQVSSILTRVPFTAAVEAGDAGALPLLRDHVTGLANRTLFADRVDRSLRRWAANGGPGLAVIQLDLDDFKRVNDSWSHAAGDDLLTAVAERLDGAVRDTDTVARFGGDEFAVLVEGVDDAEEALHAAERLRQVLAAPYTIEGRSVRVTASFGVVVSEKRTTRVEQMLRDVAVVTHLAKSQGKDRVLLFEERMQRTVQERVELETDLGRAIEHNELVLHYQPIFSIDTGRIDGFEALVRWQHPERGLIPPNDFIPLAEENGMIVALDRWVLMAACAAGKRWQDTYPSDDEPLMVCVNLSTRQLEHDAVVDLVALALEVTGLAPHHLTLEITESFVLQDESEGARRLAELRALGVRVAIDDFGTGYASLSYLRRLPVDVLKVDRSFVEGLGRTPEDSALVRAILRMAKSLDLEVTAEGVERHDQLAELAALGCTMAQGYHFSHPLPADEFDELLRIRFGGRWLSGMLSF